MNPRVRTELVVLFLYLFVILRMDRDNGFRTAALVIRWYGHRCRDLGNWAYTQAIRSDSAYRELMAP